MDTDVTPKSDYKHFFGNLIPTYSISKRTTVSSHGKSHCRCSQPESVFWDFMLFCIITQGQMSIFQTSYVHFDKCFSKSKIYQTLQKTG